MKFYGIIMTALMGFALLASADADAGARPDCGTTNSAADAACRAGLTNHGSSSGNTTTNNQGNGFQWEICINGINLQGQSCQGDSWGTWNKPRQITARGRDAIELIRNGKILASDIDASGQYRLIVTYHGQYRPAQGKTFSCTVSPDARQFECRSWTPTHRNY